MSGSTTPTREAAQAPSTSPPAVGLGEIVLVKLDQDLYRPMVVTGLGAVLGELSGQIFVEPDDHTAEVFRRLDRTIWGHRLDAWTFLAYASGLRPGFAIGQWRSR